MQYHSIIQCVANKSKCVPFISIPLMPQPACWTRDFKWSCTSAKRPFKSKKTFSFLISQSLAHRHLSLSAPCQASDPRYRMQTSYASCNFETFTSNIEKRWTVSATEILQQHFASYVLWCANMLPLPLFILIRNPQLTCDQAVRCTRTSLNVA